MYSPSQNLLLPCRCILAADVAAKSLLKPCMPWLQLSCQSPAHRPKYANLAAKYANLAASQQEHSSQSAAKSAASYSNPAAAAGPMGRSRGHIFINFQPVYSQITETLQIHGNLISKAYIITSQVQGSVPSDTNTFRLLETCKTLPALYFTCGFELLKSLQAWLTNNNNRTTYLHQDSFLGTGYCIY